MSVCIFSKVPWSLNPTRKRNVRDRLAQVRGVLDAITQTAPGLKALVRSLALFPLFLTVLWQTTTAPQPVKSKDMYFKTVRLTPYNKSGTKGIHKIPHYTKLPREHEQVIVSWSKDPSKA